MSSASRDQALVLLTEDLQKEVDRVQHLRKVLHDAYIVESEEKAGKSAAAPPPAVDVHRTLDAPTLALLKAPNYPFLLCEGAPPSYVPPPVPYDVEGEVDNMKNKVLQVQRDLVVFQERQRKNHATKQDAKNPEEVKRAMREELVDFLDGHKLFSELAWQVSSLEWFYRWVLSHSISHLWNAKDQLEFVMTEKGQALPASAEAMDEALEEIPFTQAVTILDNDRQAVIAQERRRLRSVSRTFRDRLPPMAITAATSCYLSSEEKYMYQEFYNQSEHLLLLLDHTILMERSASAGTGPHSRSRNSSSSRSLPRFEDADANALVRRSSTTGEVANIDDLTQEVLAAYNAEHEVIQTLMETIRERRRDGIQFVVSEDEYQRSRTAQTAVYGCVVSDMNLMAQQMAVAKEFLDKYEEWVRFHGFDTHDGLMQLLVERSGGSSWPYLSMSGAGSCDDPHRHFTPPTAVWAKERSQPNSAATEPSRQPSAPLDGGGGGGSAPRTGTGASPGSAAADPSSSRRPHPPSSANASLVGQGTDSQRYGDGAATLPRSASATVASTRSPSAVADIYYTILLHTDDKLAEISNDSNGHQHGVDDDSPVAAYRLERMWMAAAMRQTVLRLAQSQWTSNWLLTNLDDIEEELLDRLRQRPSYNALVPNACAFLVMLKELLVLSRRTISTARRAMTEVRVALHSSCGGDDLKREVDFALSPVEYERWGALLDALWLQADPSGAASGGLLLSVEVANANPLLPSFQRLEKIALPVAAPPSSSASAVPSQAVPVMTLLYRAQTSGTQTAGGGASFPAARSMAALLQKESTAAVPGRNDVVAQCARRYRHARAALAALYEVEAKGLLPCYACRVSECEEVPLNTVLFFSTPQASSDIMGVSVSLLPPGAVRLLRLYKRTELRRPPNASVMPPPFDIYGSEEVSFCSIGIMVSALLSSVATAARPVLKDLYMTAESTLEQANWERKNRVVPKSFVNATTQPIPMSCAATKTRAISIQREASVPNRNSISLRRFISPLLRHMDDYLATADFAQMAVDEQGDGDDEGRVSNSYANAYEPLKTERDGGGGAAGSPGTSVTARRTDMYGGRTNTSPSPSAVRPRGY